MWPFQKKETFEERKDRLERAHQMRERMIRTTALNAVKKAWQDADKALEEAAKDHKNALAKLDAEYGNLS